MKAISPLIRPPRASEPVFHCPDDAFPPPCPSKQLVLVQGLRALIPFSVSTGHFETDKHASLEYLILLHTACLRLGQLAR